MTQPRVTIITPSFNKYKYVKEAILSVHDQTFKDWRYWILENSNDHTTNPMVNGFVEGISDGRIEVVNLDFSESFRKEIYPTANLLNTYLPQITTEFFFYLSDDDYLQPSCLETLVRFMDQNPDKAVCYYSLQVQHFVNGQFEDLSTIKAENLYAKGSNMDCVLDGGQVFMRTDVLKSLEQPYFYEGQDENTAHCDGLFLNEVAKHYDFHPVPQFLSVKRRTPESTFINI